MEENYTNLSKEDLIEKLKSKDEQITEMSKKYDCLQSDATKEIENAKTMRFEAFQELKRENEELKQQHEFAIKTLQKQHKEQIDGLKETIVTMTVHSYTAQESFFNIIRDIDKKLNLIIQRSGKDE